MSTTNNDMKRLFFAMLMLLCGMLPLMAQSSMTDEQVLSYVIKEQQKGSTQQEIATKLVQKGVTIDQLRRVQKKAERLKKEQGLGAVKQSSVEDTDPDGRLRKSEIYQRRDPNSTTAKLKDDKLSSKQSNKDKRRKIEQLEREEDVDMTKQALDEFMPDSLDLYDRMVIRNYLKAKAEHEKKDLTKIFGHELFTNEDLTFEPAMNIATPSDYILGAGDEVIIDIYGASQKSVKKTVSPDGVVVIEDFGPIQVGGLTVEQATQRVRSQLGSRFASSKISLAVGQTRTITVNVMGEVKMPGTYSLSAFASVFHALYMAGGPSKIGTLRNIKVFRNNRQVATIDVYDYILNGKLKGNVRLQDNDVIILGAYDCLVSLSGKVKRPMYYEMKRDENLAQLIEYAGGFAGNAYRKSVRLIRRTGTEYSVHTVGEFDMASFRMADADSVMVDSLLPRYSNMVEVKGAVFRPGMYQLGEQVSSVKGLLEVADGVTEEAFTPHAVMHRLKADRTLEVIQVDVQGILDGTVADIPLKNEDVLFVPTKQDVNAERTIAIHGEVLYPGTYKYADNETVEDFILQAGGLTETASTANVFVSRRVINSKATSSDSIIGETFNFALKDGFVIDGQPGFHLQPFDEVFVRRSPGYYEQKNVTIEGEVLFAGEYTMSRQNERLSDLVKKAGGVTNMAYVAGARLERKMNESERLRYEESLKMQDEQNLAVLMEQALKSGRSVSEMQSAQRETRERKREIPTTYMVGIELEKAIAKPGSDHDLILREGDRLIVPQHTGTVKINGEVMYPNTVGFEEGKKVKYYINQAGGYSSKAKKGRTYIIYMNGDVAKVKSRTKVRPGCEIVVPAKAQNKMTTAETVTLGSGIASIATMIATLANILTK